MARLHPSELLYAGEAPFPVISACDHYAGSERAASKALSLQAERGGAFDVTLDLEDGAPAGRERTHAELFVDLLRAHAGKPGAVGARVHPARHPAFADDLRVLLSGALPQLAHLTLPKATGLADVEQALAAIRAQGGEALPVHVLIETHGALRDAHAIAGLPQVRGLDFGIMDFVSSHHGAIPEEAMRSPLQFEHALVVRAKCELVAAALGAGKVPAHNVTLALKDPITTRADAARARRELGFLRMWSIHPEQIAPILAAMRPGEEEVERASRVLLAAQTRDWAPLEHQGRLYDRASYRFLWELLQRARLISGSVQGEAEEAFFGE